MDEDADDNDEEGEKEEEETATGRFVLQTKLRSDEIKSRLFKDSV